MPAHSFDTNSTEWTAHEHFPAIRVKVLESHATHPHSSIMLVRLAVGGEIQPHLHEIETETAYVLAGQGVLQVEAETIPFLPGTGASIPPRHVHSLKNTGNVELELIAIHTPPTR
jgi:mannose-6-phosphate isomerase-like protein (cupin superfamily)